MMSKEAILEAIRTDENSIADLIISQEKTIDALTKLVEDYRARVELLLLDSEKDELH